MRGIAQLDDVVNFHGRGVAVFFQAVSAEGMARYEPGPESPPIGVIAAFFGRPAALVLLAEVRGPVAPAEAFPDRYNLRASRPVTEFGRHYAFGTISAEFESSNGVGQKHHMAFEN